jgi:hypothetical protein
MWKPSPPISVRSLWLILKNVIGWVLILLSLVVGPIPGPGGMVLFLVGFGMIWFPAKRHLVARLLRRTTRVRRSVRPWLRRAGIHLLPPRGRPCRCREDVPTGRSSQEIVRIHPRHRTRLRKAWKTSAPWLRRLVGLAITVAIFAWMLRPVLAKWDQVGERVRAINWGLFALASVMFAMFLFCFRVVSWRTILAGFGSRLPLPAATRIWSTSELARYLPGVIWQVVGRVYLCKPYGVSGTVCSTSQILELVVFLLANILVALSCLMFFAYRMTGHALNYLWLTAALVPLLLMLLHPKVF